MNETFSVRNVSSDDLPFIYSTWLKGLYYGNSWFREIDKDVFFKAYHQSIENVLKNNRCYIKVACLKDDPDVILGYSVLQQKEDGSSILHWIFTKLVWRKMGIAKALVQENIKQVSHLTDLGKNLKPKEWAFNPFE